jgi:hypothetical protein
MRPVYVTPASHSLGVGGRVGSPSFGLGASARAWRRDRFGMQLAVSRYALASTTAGSERQTTFQIEPSVLYSLRDRVTDYMWLRPYVGSGLGLRRQTAASAAPGALDSTSSGLGFQAFGGGEMTFAGAPQFAISADLTYRWLRTPTAGGALGGPAVSVSGHWYVK